MNVTGPNALQTAEVLTMKAGGLQPGLLGLTHAPLVHQRLVAMYLRTGEDALLLAQITRLSLIDLASPRQHQAVCCRTQNARQGMSLPSTSPAAR